MLFDSIIKVVLTVIKKNKKKLKFKNVRKQLKTSQNMLKSLSSIENDNINI